MKARRRVALAAFGFLLLVLTASPNRPRELSRRLRLVAHDAGRDLALRRLDGSSAAFDRRYFFFLESARRRLPARAAGVAVQVPAPTEAFRDLALYHFAPLPALLVKSVAEVPSGWVLAVYGAARPDGWREIARVSDGALLARAP
ncbi:MAG: hypothetical protein ACM3SU_07900 [Acidobacteriota bacterium]